MCSFLLQMREDSLFQAIWHFTCIYQEAGACAKVALGSYRNEQHVAFSHQPEERSWSSKPQPNLAYGIFFLSCEDLFKKLDWWPMSKDLKISLKKKNPSVWLIWKRIGRPFHGQGWESLDSNHR